VGGRDILGVIAVAGERCDAPVLQPEIHLSAVLEAAEHHDFMVPDQGNQMTAIHLFKQQFNDAGGIGAAIDQVSQGDNRVLFLGRDCT
jgi:hypothetical protein